MKGNCDKLQIKLPALCPSWDPRPSFIQLCVLWYWGSALPISCQCCLPLYTRGNSTTIKGNKGEKAAVWHVSGGRKKFPAAVAGRQVLKLLSMLASISGKNCIFVLLRHKEEMFQFICLLCSVEVFLYLFLFCCLSISSTTFFCFYFSLSYSAIPSFIALLSSPC